MDGRVAAADDPHLPLEAGDAAHTLAVQPPDFSHDDAAELARDVFGLDGELTRLDGERDQNFRIDAPDGAFVLKVSNPAEERAVIAMQVAAMERMAAVEPGLSVPRVRRTRAGEPYALVERAGRTHVVHVVDFLHGVVLGRCDLDAEALGALGAAVARAGRALRGFFHPAAGRVILWDVQHALRLRPVVRYIESPDRAALVARALDGFEQRAARELPALRSQVVHGDLTLSNVLFGDDRRPTAIFDFGDAAHTVLVGDLAVTLAALVRGGEDTWETVRALVRGYEAVTPLEEEETAVLPYLVAARLAATVVISAWRVRRFPENTDYITAYDDSSWAALELFDALGHDEMVRRFARATAAGTVQRAGRQETTPRLARRRRRLLGAALEPLSYDRPVRPVRASGVWIVEADGRRLLDAYNNVPVAGHSHPRVVAAVAEQGALLNTNTRYLHESALELAERLTATMPRSLDTCLFVNSGSEANDLAWRLATAVTGGAGAIVSQSAYHGITTALADLSPSEWAEPERPAHVATVPPGDAAAVGDAASELADAGHRLGAMFLDAAWTSDGIFPDTRPYLPEAVRRVREAGGLFVADEVQCGHGRLGDHLWGFAASGAEPDFVTLGKPMGNGHPVAAVVTHAAVAETFARRRAPLFSTFGGNPVACSAALAVLDVVEEEDLVTRSAAVGTHLRTGLQELATRHPVVRDVRGAGLLVGVELMRDEATSEPLRAPTARAVANAMRDHGVLVGTTGPAGNVLKIRPPLVFEREHADLLVGVLDAVLAESAPR
jgi:4-aminobutyrate aminotransferase-like enzyme/Ser/Thr protein kinase RdoA (MazF antagonist)